MADAMFARTASHLGAAAPPSETGGITSRINHAHEIISQIDGHVAAGSAVLWGPVPEMAEKSPPKVVQQGVLAEAAEGLDRMIERLQRLEQRAARLRGL